MKRKGVTFVTSSQRVTVWVGSDVARMPANKFRYVHLSIGNVSVKLTPDEAGELAMLLAEEHANTRRQR